MEQSGAPSATAPAQMVSRALRQQSRKAKKKAAIADRTNELRRIRVIAESLTKANAALRRENNDLCRQLGIEPRYKLAAYEGA